MTRFNPRPEEGEMVQWATGLPSVIKCRGAWVRVKMNGREREETKRDGDRERRERQRARHR